MKLSNSLLFNSKKERDNSLKLCKDFKNFKIKDINKDSLLFKLNDNSTKNYSSYTNNNVNEIKYYDEKPLVTFKSNQTRKNYNNLKDLYERAYSELKYNYYDLAVVNFNNYNYCKCNCGSRTICKQKAFKYNIPFHILEEIYLNYY
jgi:hypothetical protein